MGCVYFTRHGQTVWNVENKICGASDIALTEKGIKQAKELGEFIRNSIAAGEMRIDEILYSPLIRAKETAGYISAATGIPTRCEERLREQNFGRFECTPRDGAEFKVAKCNFIDHYGTGETMLHLAWRIYNLLDDIKKESDEKTYLLVAHNGISRVINSYFHDMTNEEYAAFGIKNCEVLKFDFANKCDLYLREYREGDAYSIVTWLFNEKSFYQWSAGRMGEYPITGDRLSDFYKANQEIKVYCACDKIGTVVGQVTMRYPDANDLSKIRFGFIIVDKSIRGKGYGKKMLRLAFDYAFNVLNASEVSLGVFSNNEGAMHCYEAAGLVKTGEVEMYDINGEQWECIEMKCTKTSYLCQEEYQ